MARGRSLRLACSIHQPLLRVACVVRQNHNNNNAVHRIAQMHRVFNAAPHQESAQPSCVTHGCGQRRHRNRSAALAVITRRTRRRPDSTPTGAVQVAVANSRRGREQTSHPQDSARFVGAVLGAGAYDVTILNLGHCRSACPVSSRIAVTPFDGGFLVADAAVSATILIGMTPDGS